MKLPPLEFHFMSQNLALEFTKIQICSPFIVFSSKSHIILTNTFLISVNGFDAIRHLFLATLTL